MERFYREILEKVMFDLCLRPFITSDLIVSVSPLFSLLSLHLFLIFKLLSPYIFMWPSNMHTSLQNIHRPARELQESCGNLQKIPATFKIFQTMVTIDQFLQSQIRNVSRVVSVIVSRWHRYGGRKCRVRVTQVIISHWFLFVCIFSICIPHIQHDP